MTKPTDDCGCAKGTKVTKETLNAMRDAYLASVPEEFRADVAKGFDAGCKQFSRGGK